MNRLDAIKEATSYAFHIKTIVQQEMTDYQ